MRVAAVEVLHMYSRPTSLAATAAMIAFVALVSGCAGQPERIQETRGHQQPARDASRIAVPDSKTRRSVHERAALTAVRQVGVPYRYGGTDVDGFDCSGLVHYAYRQAGKSVPRTTGSLWRSLERVSRGELRVGDILFFRIAGKVSHVGMYLGGRKFVHAPQSGRSVSIAKLDSPYYSKVYVGAGRP